jgi:hypothetical protein
MYVTSAIPFEQLFAEGGLPVLQALPLGDVARNDHDGLDVHAGAGFRHETQLIVAIPERRRPGQLGLALAPAAEDRPRDRLAGVDLGRRHEADRMDRLSEQLGDRPSEGLANGQVGGQEAELGVEARDQVGRVVDERLGQMARLRRLDRRRQDVRDRA